MFAFIEPVPSKSVERVAAGTGLDVGDERRKRKGMEVPGADHLATIDWQRGKWAGAAGKYVSVRKSASGAA